MLIPTATVATAANGPPTTTVATSISPTTSPITTDAIGPIIYVHLPLSTLY